MASFSSTAALADAEILRQFHSWLRNLIKMCGGKDVHDEDGAPIKGLFEGLPGSSLEKLNTRFEMLLCTNTIHYALP